MKYTHVLSNEMQVTWIIRRPGICASDKRWITGGIMVVFITEGIPGLLVINILQSVDVNWRLPNKDTILSNKLHFVSWIDLI